MKENKLKILYIIPSLAPGGAERFILDLIYSIDKDKFEPTLLMFNGGGFFLKDFRKRKIAYRILNKKYKIDIKNFLDIYRYIKRVKPDIVHTQLGGDIYGKLAAKMAGVKTIISTEQNVAINDSWLILKFKRITASFSDKLVAISEAVRSDVVKKYRLPESKVELIHNGLNIEKFSNIKKINNKNNSVIIGSVGRLSEQKNFSLLIKALSFFEDFKFECLIVGDGELKSALQNQIVELGLQSKIKLLGKRENVPEFLSTIDFFVLPSKWEGLGVVLLEAGALSLPVLASATGGILDLIDDGQTGILFKNNNLEDLKKKLKYFFDKKNKEKLEVMANNLNKEVIKNFDIKVIAKKYEDLYLDLIK
ncbi:MAG: glycosyltransferase [Patescibacteria group bacterium]